MYRSILFALAACAFGVSITLGDDYLLRIDTLGTDGPASEVEPPETMLHSIEIIARSRMPFRGRVGIGAETVSVAGNLHPADRIGKLRPADRAEFTVQLEYQHLVDTGMTFPGDNGIEKPEINRSSFQTTISIPVGTPIDIGGRIEETKAFGKKKRRIKKRYVLTLLKYEPHEG